MEVFSDQLNRKNIVALEQSSGLLGPSALFYLSVFYPHSPFCLLPPAMEKREMPTSGEQKPLIETWSFLFVR